MDFIFKALISYSVVLGGLLVICMGVIKLQEGFKHVKKNHDILK
jgi:hypothetical protein